MKTYGKHQVPMLEEKEAKKVGGEHAEDKRIINEAECAEQKSVSALNKIALLNSPVPRRHIPLLSSGVKLPTPPVAFLLNATNIQQNNIHKSASSPSLQTKVHLGTTNERQEEGNELDRTVPNAAQMLLAARNRGKQMAIASPRNVGKRLPPLQLPKGAGEQKMKVFENGATFNPTPDKVQGMIATLATRPLPQLQPLRQSQNNVKKSELAQCFPPPPYNSTDVMSSSLPIPTNIANVPPSQFLANLQSHPRRRPSSADAITTNPHKPLPSISAQLEAKRHDILSRDGNFAKRSANRIRCRTTVKCALIGGFLSVSVLIFVLIMLLSSDGFSPHSDVSAPSQGTTSAASSTTAATTLPVSVPTTDVNIVGGAIFQPISMQNVSRDNK